MKKSKNQIFSVIVLTLILIQTVSFNVLNSNLPLEIKNGKDSMIAVPEDILDDSLINQNQNIPLSGAEYPSSWWNESYQYRMRVEINNTKSFSRNQPIDLDYSFVQDHAFNNSIRIIYYEEVSGEDVWVQLPCQVWNATYNGNFYQTLTITFVVDSLQAGVNIFYLYYHPESIVDDTDYSGNTMTSSLATNQLDVAWKDMTGLDYAYSMKSDYGSYQLQDNYGVNRHSDTSSSPGLIDFTKNLVGYWNFDDDTATEQTGNVLGGSGVGYIDHGNINYDVGKYGRARSFDGTGDYIAINGDEALYGGSVYSEGITVMAWVKIGGGSGERIIASWDRSEYWRLSITADNRILWATASGGIQDMYEYVTDLGDSEWHHIAATYDPVAGTKAIYLDNLLVNQITAHSGYPLGYTSYPARYGFIGTGSEASSFDGSMGPANEWFGLMDEMRIYSAALSLDEVNLAKESGVQTDVNTITAEIEGEVLSQYSVDWNPLEYETGKYLDVNDTMTFYRSMNAMKVTRDYYFDSLIAPSQNNTAFAAWNSLYSWDSNDLDLNQEDYYYYDNQMFEGHDNVDFSPENYTVLFDYDGDTYFTALGLFISDIELGYPSGSSISELKWKIDVNTGENSINFVPGNETDLDLPTGSNYYLRIEFWEFILNDYSAGGYDVAGSPNYAQTYFDNYYQSLITPLEIETKTEESLFFIVDLNVFDIDNNNIPNVNASLLYSNGTYISSSLTNSFGNTSFAELGEEDYVLNLTYSPSGYSDLVELGEFSFTLNNTETTYLNTRVISQQVNMTSITVHFESNLEGTDLVGAEIEFQEFPGGSIVGSEFTDENGNVTLHWRNMTSGNSLIQFSCNFLGDPTRPIKNETGAFADYVEEELEFYSYANIAVQIGDFETIMNMTDLTESYTWGENLAYNISYSFNESSTISPIPDADVSYLIQYRNDIIHEGMFNDTDVDGISLVSFDYETLGIPLESGIEYTFRVSVSKAGYTSITNISNILISDINTTLIMDIDNPHTAEWNELVNISVFFNDTYYDDPIVDEMAPNNVEITYTDLLDSSITGIFVPDLSKTDGWYVTEINTSIVFGEIGDYTLEIVASKLNYETQSTTYLLDIEAISTSLIVEDADITVFWGYNFSLDVQFTNESIGLTNAEITWEVVGNSDINGELVLNSSRTNGWYSSILNSTLLNRIGEYSIEISTTLANYESQVAIVALLINPVQTLIKINTGDATGDLLSMSVSINETDSYNFNLYYINYFTQENIANVSMRLFSWNLMSNDSISGSGEIYSIGDYYSLDFDTTELGVGDYALLVTFGESNFEQRQAFIFLTVEKRIISYILAGDIETGQFINDRGSNWNLSIQLYDSSRDFNPLLTASVSIYFETIGLLWYFNDPNSDGIYNYTAIWSEIESIFVEDTYIAILAVQNDTFIPISIELTFVVQDRTISMNYEGDFSGAQITRYLGDDWDLSIRLADDNSGLSLLDSLVKLTITSDSFNEEYILIDENNQGYYTFIVDWDSIKSELDEGTYQAVLSVEKFTYVSLSYDITIILNERIIDMEFVGDIKNAQMSKLKGDQWNLSMQIYDTSRYYIGLTDANITISFPDLNDYQFILEDLGDGQYTAIVDWNDVKSIFTNPTSYTGIITIQKENFATLSIDMTLIISDRRISISYAGDINDMKVTKVNGETISFEIELLDNHTHSPLLNANVRISFGENIPDMILEDLAGNGVYTGVKAFAKEEINAFFSDKFIPAELIIDAENYDIPDETISITIKMIEIAEGIPTFYLLLAVGAVVIVAVTVGGYRYVQYARIPAFVKLIDKVKKDIGKNHDVSDQNVTLSIHEEIIERFADRWQLLDLDLSTILGKNSVDSSVDSNITTGDEEVGGL